MDWVGVKPPQPNYTAPASPGVLFRNNGRSFPLCRQAGDAPRDYSGERRLVNTLLHSLAGLQPGEHLLLLYETAAQHRAALTPYLRQGLARGEKTLYILGAPAAETRQGDLREAGVEGDAGLRAGQWDWLTAESLAQHAGSLTQVDLRRCPATGSAAWQRARMTT